MQSNNPPLVLILRVVNNITFMTIKPCQGGIHRAVHKRSYGGLWHCLSHSSLWCLSNKVGAPVLSRARFTRSVQPIRQRNLWRGLSLWSPGCLQSMPCVERPMCRLRRKLPLASRQLSTVHRIGAGQVMWHLKSPTRPSPVGLHRRCGQPHSLGLQVPLRWSPHGFEAVPRPCDRRTGSPAR